MKGNIKKSIIVIMIIAIASFILTATVSADGNKIKHRLHGTYAKVGGGTGLMAFCGFDEYQQPVNASHEFGPYWIISVVIEGIFTLNPDGSGTTNDTAFVQGQPNPLLGPPNYPPMMYVPWVGEQTLNSPITYEVTEDGSIIISTVGATIGEWKSGPLAGVSMSNAPASWRCRMTPDHKALTCVRILTAGDAGQGLCGDSDVVAKIINNDFFVAIWQHKN